MLAGDHKKSDRLQHLLVQLFSIRGTALMRRHPSCTGIRLLQNMGWRQGKGVGPALPAQTPGKAGSRWGSEPGVSPENTPIYALAPKTDQHGLGFDPFKVGGFACFWPPALWY